MTINEPGDYGVTYYISGAPFSTELHLIVKEEISEPSIERDIEEKEVTATPNKSNVVVDYENIEFEAYTITGYNYFKLRDIAKVVSGTNKQFEVTWDNANKAINLLSGLEYTKLGNELSKGDGLEKQGILNTSKIYKDGAEIELTAYTINGNNYFKLRDLGETFNIGITWNNETKTVGINTSTGYVE